MSGPIPVPGDGGGDGGLERLRAAWAAADGTAPDPRTCPPPATLWEAAHGELPPPAAAGVIEHLAGCADCAAAWRLAIELEPLPRAAAAGSRERPWEVRQIRRPFAPIFRGAYARRLAAAAAILLACAGAWWQMRQAAPPRTAAGPVYRGAPAAAGRLQLPPLTRCPQSGCRLQWRGQAGATYRLEVRTASGAPVLDRGGLAEPSFQLTSHDLLGFAPGARLRWTVTATSRQGLSFESPPADLILSLP